jgi:hypothetical protein
MQWSRVGRAAKCVTGYVRADTIIELIRSLDG